MNLISREELKDKLDRGDDFKLLMVMGEWQFRAMHIPGSLSFTPQAFVQSPKAAMQRFGVADELVVC